MDPDATSGNFSGIDPDRFKKVIESVEHGHETLRGRALYFKNQLASYGLGQSELQGIVHSASWAGDELPMLKRRYHLSLAEGAPGFAGHEGMVRINEALVNPAAVREAKKAAKRAAALAKKNPEDLSATEFDELNTLLADNRDEYPFAETFAETLGAKGTLTFWDELSNAGALRGAGNEGVFARRHQLGDFQKNLSYTLAAATNSGTAAMRAWKKDMIALGGKPIRGGGTDGASGPDGFVVMSNLMRVGDFDDAFLTDYGKALMEKDREHQSARGVGYSGVWQDGGALNHLGNDLGNDPMTGYMKALANSPAAATKFFTANGKDAKGKKQSNFTYLFEERKWPGDSAPGEESVTGLNSLGHALEAATTGHRPGELATAENLKHTKAQAGLFGDIVDSVSHENDTLLKRGFLSDSMANMSVDYLPDLQQSLAGDTKGRKSLYPTVGASAEIQQKAVAVRFLHLVARNPEGYDKLNISQHVYAAALMEQHQAHPEKYKSNATNTINTLAYETGLFQGILADAQRLQADSDAMDAKAKGEAWKGHVSTWGGSVVGSVAGIATASFSGPGGVVVGGLVGTAAGKTFDGIVNGFGDSEKKRTEQVYKNVLSESDAERSAALTVQNSVEEVTGDGALTADVGPEATQGIRDAGDLVRSSF